MRFHFGQHVRKSALRLRRWQLILICLGVLVLCLTGLIRYVNSAWQSAAQQKVLEEIYYAEASPSPMAMPASAQKTGAIIRQYEVLFTKDEPEPEAPQPTATPRTPVWPDNPGRSVLPAFQQLQRQNKDIIGWLSIPDVLEQAVVQRDNEYYLRRDYLGKANDNGALFLEAGIPLTGRPDAYIVFGHNMKSGLMFGSLRLYENVAYYRRNALLNFNVLYEDGQYVIFAVANVDIIKGLPRYAPFMQLNTLEGAARQACIQTLRNLSKISTPIAVGEEDQLLLLVTCDGSDNERRVVAARRLRAGETAESLAAAIQNAKQR